MIRYLKVQLKDKTYNTIESDIPIIKKSNKQYFMTDGTYLYIPCNYFYNAFGDNYINWEGIHKKYHLPKSIFLNDNLSVKTSELVTYPFDNFLMIADNDLNEYEYKQLIINTQKELDSKIESITNTYVYTFELCRKSKNASLTKGNHMISANDNMHHLTKSQIVKFLRGMGYEMGLLNKPTIPFSTSNPCTVTIDIYKPKAQRTDAPNYYLTVKPLLDGLTDAGIWEDDNDNVIIQTLFNKMIKHDKKHYIMKITVKEILR